MAVYWNLGLVARTRNQAEACAAYFRGKQLIVDAIDVPLEVSQSECPDGWLVGVWPRGMSHGSPNGNDPRLTSDAARRQIARVFDDWLRDAPPFMVAFFGGEAYDMFISDPVAEVLDPEGFAGLVVDEATWTALGKPTAAQALGAGRFAWPRASSSV